MDLMDVWSHLDVLTIGLFPHVAGWNHREPISVNVCVCGGGGHLIKCMARP